MDINSNGQYSIEQHTKPGIHFQTLQLVTSQNLRFSSQKFANCRVRQKPRYTEKGYENLVFENKPVPYLKLKALSFKKDNFERILSANKIPRDRFGQH